LPHIIRTHSEPINGVFFFFLSLSLSLDTSQTSGVAWNAFIGCTSSGVPSTRCQITDQPHWKTDDCVTIAFFDPSYISVNENGYCSFGYNDKGLLVFEPTGACDYTEAVMNGDYAVKGQLTPGGVLELLFTDDGGATFYNEDNVRLALNAAN
jgi:hypothetical protein